MYTPVDSPYVSHADGLAIHTAYIEKVRAYTLSRLDVADRTIDRHVSIDVVCRSARSLLLSRTRRLQFWASSVSMYDFLVPKYPRSEL